MNLIAQFLRALAKLRFKLLGLATITDIPTDDFNRLVSDLVDEGWKPGGVYDGLDAWIDYGSLHLRKGRTRLLLEWDNWTEGSLEGPKKAVEAIASQHGYEVSNQWRWSIYDD